jgi:pyridoxamine 5'-phosphate oxidase
MREGGFEVEPGADPLALFERWMTEAKASELNDPSAMSLACSTRDGLPSVRMVLMRGLDHRGFHFFTNGESRKGDELHANPHAALCFHWKSLRRQVRVEGLATELPGADSDAYFWSRARLSQIGAWASAQSRVLTSRKQLLDRVNEFEAKFPGVVPRPPYWTGFAIQPARIEFWQDGEFRLHDRFSFQRGGDGSWVNQRLYP